MSDDVHHRWGPKIDIPATVTSIAVDANATFVFPRHIDGACHGYRIVLDVAIGQISLANFTGIPFAALAAFLQKRIPNLRVKYLSESMALATSFITRVRIQYACGRLALRSCPTTRWYVLTVGIPAVILCKLDGYPQFLIGPTSPRIAACVVGGTVLFVYALSRGIWMLIGDGRRGVDSAQQMVTSALVDRDGIIAEHQALLREQTRQEQRR
jgi:hypothetical protein